MKEDPKISFTTRTLTARDADLASELFHFFQVDDGIENPTRASKDYLTRILSRTDFHVIIAAVDENIIC